MEFSELAEYHSILNLEGEVWRDIKGYEGVYQVSNLGRVKSLARIVTMRNQVCTYSVHKKECIMKGSITSCGYPQVILSNPTKRVARVHRLVAETFLAPPSQEILDECREAGLDYVLINHRDSNRKNSSLYNLEWCTPSYNLYYEGTRIGLPSVSGSNSTNAILTEDDVTKILELLRGGGISQEKIAEMFGVKQITISNIWCGRSWSHFTGIPRTERVRRKDERKTKSLSEQEFS